MKINSFPKTTGSKGRAIARNQAKKQRRIIVLALAAFVFFAVFGLIGSIFWDVENRWNREKEFNGLALAILSPGAQAQMDFGPLKNMSGSDIYMDLNAAERIPKIMGGPCEGTMLAQNNLVGAWRIDASGTIYLPADNERDLNIAFMASCKYILLMDNTNLTQIEAYQESFGKAIHLYSVLRRSDYAEYTRLVSKYGGGDPVPEFLYKLPIRDLDELGLKVPPLGLP